MSVRSHAIPAFESVSVLLGQYGAKLVLGSDHVLQASNVAEDGRCEQGESDLFRRLNLLIKGYRLDPDCPADLRPPSGLSYAAPLSRLVRQSRVPDELTKGSHVCPLKDHALRFDIASVLLEGSSTVSESAPMSRFLATVISKSGATRVTHGGPACARALSEGWFCPYVTHLAGMSTLGAEVGFLDAMHPQTELGLENLLPDVSVESDWRRRIMELYSWSRHWKGMASGTAHAGSVRAGARLLMDVTQERISRSLPWEHKLQVPLLFGISNALDQSRSDITLHMAFMDIARSGHSAWCAPEEEAGLKELLEADMLLRNRVWVHAYPDGRTSVHTQHGAIMLVPGDPAAYTFSNADLGELSDVAGEACSVLESVRIEVGLEKAREVELKLRQLWNLLSSSGDHTANAIAASLRDFETLAKSKKTESVNSVTGERARESALEELATSYGVPRVLPVIRWAWSQEDPYAAARWLRPVPSVRFAPDTLSSERVRIWGRQAPLDEAPAEWYPGRIVQVFISYHAQNFRAVPAVLRARLAAAGHSADDYIDRGGWEDLPHELFFMSDLDGLGASLRTLDLGGTVDSVNIPPRRDHVIDPRARARSTPELTREVLFWAGKTDEEVVVESTEGLLHADEWTGADVIGSKCEAKIFGRALNMQTSYARKYNSWVEELASRVASSVPGSLMSSSVSAIREAVEEAERAKRVSQRVQQFQLYTDFEKFGNWTASRFSRPVREALARYYADRRILSSYDDMKSRRMVSHHGGFMFWISLPGNWNGQGLMNKLWQIGLAAYRNEVKCRAVEAMTVDGVKPILRHLYMSDDHVWMAVLLEATIERVAAAARGSVRRRARASRSLGVDVAVGLMAPIAVAVATESGLILQDRKVSLSERWLCLLNECFVDGKLSRVVSRASSTFMVPTSHRAPGLVEEMESISGNASAALQKGIQLRHAMLLAASNLALYLGHASGSRDALDLCRMSSAAFVPCDLGGLGMPPVACWACGLGPASDEEVYVTLREELRRSAVLGSMDGVVIGSLVSQAGGFVRGAKCALTGNPYVPAGQGQRAPASSLVSEMAVKNQRVQAWADEHERLRASRDEVVGQIADSYEGIPSVWVNSLIRAHPAAEAAAVLQKVTMSDTARAVVGRAVLTRCASRSARQARRHLRWIASLSSAAPTYEEAFGFGGVTKWSAPPAVGVRDLLRECAREEAVVRVTPRERAPRAWSLRVEPGSLSYCSPSVLGHAQQSLVSYLECVEAVRGFAGSEDSKRELHGALYAHVGVRAEGGLFRDGATFRSESHLTCCVATRSYGLLGVTDPASGVKIDSEFEVETGGAELALRRGAPDCVVRHGAIQLAAYLSAYWRAVKGEPIAYSAEVDVRAGYDRQAVASRRAVVVPRSVVDRSSTYHALVAASRRFRAQVGAQRGERPAGRAGPFVASLVEAVISQRRGHEDNPPGTTVSRGVMAPLVHNLGPGEEHAPRGGGPVDVGLFATAFAKLFARYLLEARSVVISAVRAAPLSRALVAESPVHEALRDHFPDPAEIDELWVQLVPPQHARQAKGMLATLAGSTRSVTRVATGPSEILRQSMRFVPPAIFASLKLELGRLPAPFSLEPGRARLCAQQWRSIRSHQAVEYAAALAEEVNIHLLEAGRARLVPQKLEGSGLLVVLVGVLRSPVCRKLDGAAPALQREQERRMRGLAVLCLEAVCKGAFYAHMAKCLPHVSKGAPTREQVVRWACDSSVHAFDAVTRLMYGRLRNARRARRSLVEGTAHAIPRAAAGFIWSAHSQLLADAGCAHSRGLFDTLLDSADLRKTELPKHVLENTTMAQAQAAQLLTGGAGGVRWADRRAEKIEWAAALGQPVAGEIDPEAVVLAEIAAMGGLQRAAARDPGQLVAARRRRRREQAEAEEREMHEARERERAEREAQNERRRERLEADEARVRAEEQARAEAARAERAAAEEREREARRAREQERAAEAGAVGEGADAGGAEGGLAGGYARVGEGGAAEDRPAQAELPPQPVKKGFRPKRFALP